MTGPSAASGPSKAGERAHSLSGHRTFFPKRSGGDGPRATAVFGCGNIEFASPVRRWRHLLPVLRRIVFILAGILAGAGCGRRETLVEAGARDQVFHIGNKDEPTDLDPHINTANSTANILIALFQGLVVFSKDGRTILPGMADRWELSPDGLVYTFHIRDGARWSNGQPLTSKDFLDSFMRLLDPQVACEDVGWAFPIRGARDFVEGKSTDPSTIGISAPDPHTFVVALLHPAPYMLMLLTNTTFFPVYMPSLDANGGRRQRGGPWTRPGVLVSNGPFVLAEWKPNAYVSVKRNPNFWDAERIRLREIRFYPTDDEDAEERAFRAGQLHVTFRLPKTKVPVYEAEHSPEMHVVPALRTNYLSFNVGKAPLADSRVRRAFSLAIDRERLVHAALGELGTAAFSFVRPGTGGYLPPRGFPFDPAEGRRLLESAGYPAGSGMPPVELTLNGNSGTTIAVAEVLQQMWAENLGVRVTVRPLEFKVYLSTEREKQYQVLLEGWSYSIPDARDLLEEGVSDDPGNDTGGSFADYDAAFEAADATGNQALRREAFDKMEAITAREGFYAPVDYLNQVYLVHSSVRGWIDDPLGNVQDWRDIYLEP
jgi:oligopeptide transport system substrate-binding protein